MNSELKKVVNLLIEYSYTYKISRDQARIEVNLPDEEHIVCISLDEDGQEDCFRLKVCVKQSGIIEAVNPTSWSYFDDYHSSFDDLLGELELMKTITSN